MGQEGSYLQGAENSQGSDSSIASLGLRVSQSMFYHGEDSQNISLDEAIDLAILTLLWGATPPIERCKLSIIDIANLLGYQHATTHSSQIEVIRKSLKRLNERTVHDDTIRIRFDGTKECRPSERIDFTVLTRPMRDDEPYVYIQGADIAKLIRVAEATQHKYQDLLAIFVGVKRYMRTIEWINPDTKNREKCAGTYIHLGRIAEDLGILLKTVVGRFDAIWRADVIYAEPYQQWPDAYYVCNAQHPSAMAAVKAFIYRLDHPPKPYHDKQKKYLF